MMKDKCDIADAEKSKLTVDYLAGEEVEKFFAEIYAISAQVKERLSFTEGRKKNLRRLSCSTIYMPSTRV